MDNCIRCSEIIDGDKRIGKYFADNSPEVVQKKLSSNFKVDEGYICTNCWDLIKKDDNYKFLNLFSNLFDENEK